MAIRQRIKAIDPTEVKVVEEVQSFLPPRKIVHVPVVMVVQEDRGTFGFGTDPYPGCTYDDMGIPQDKAHSVVAASAYVHSPPVPKEMSVQDLLAQVRMSNNPADQNERRYRNRTRSPLTAIRGWCVSQCQSGSPKAVGECQRVECIFWAFRLGSNAMRNRK